MSKKVGSIAAGLGVASIAALAAIGFWRSRGAHPPLVSFGRTPSVVMGTAWHMTAVAQFDHSERAHEALDRAEREVRDIESLMSVHLRDSEISRFNAASSGVPFPLSADTLTVLTQAQRFAEVTDGAFDVTCYPLVRLWAEAREANRLPTAEEIARARRRVGMFHLRFDPDGVTKLVDGVQVDLGGIAKGYAVDRALLAIKSAGLPGGMVNIGGDLRCFGTTETRSPWRIGIADPFREGKLCTSLALHDAAVATSGDYARFYEIAGHRYSHILDPRQGLPVEQTHSVTVISLATKEAPASAAKADAWATALTVLGPSGLSRLDEQKRLEAIVITGSPEDPEVFLTPGFQALMAPGAKIEFD